ncbi:MAG: ABC transporter permease [Planctomycetes bacterium]|nr:ABC transporter permease [Planctomycetota bacterium]
MNAQPIDFWGLAAAYGLLIFPLAIILWTKTPLLGKMAVAVVRITLQLLFVGLYLQVVFKLNNPWLNSLWVLVMITAADVSILHGAGLSVRQLGPPLFMALVVGITIPLLYFVGVILNNDNLLEARFVIPIGGMILGNCLRANVIGVRSFYQSIRQGNKAFLQQLAEGATLAEATRPFLRNAMQEALAPTIASMAAMGLVSLPGMMTGVILGGSDPSVAVMYQIAIMLSIFVGTSITILLAILLSRKIAFDGYGLLDRGLFK